MPKHARARTARLLRSRLSLPPLAWLALSLFIQPATGGLPGIKAISGQGEIASSNETAATNGTGNVVPQVEDRLAVAREELAAAEILASDSPTNLPDGLESQEVWSRRTLLQRLVGLYEQQISTTAELQSTKSNRAAMVKQAQDWTGFAEPRPYSIHLADRLREELQSERLKISSGESATVILEQLVEENRKTLRLAEEKLRQLDEQLEKVLIRNLPHAWRGNANWSDFGRRSPAPRSPFSTWNDRFARRTSRLLAFAQGCSPGKSWWPTRGQFFR